MPGLLHADPRNSSVGILANVQINGLTVPVLLTSPHAALTPPILSGHALDANNQIVLGAATIAALHKKVGDTVLVSYGAPKDAPIYVPPSPMRIVGTATMPAIGVSGHLHPSMGTGGLIPTGLEPPAFKKALTDPDPNLNGPIIDVVRLKSGVSPGAGRRSLHRIVVTADRVMAADPNGPGDTYAVLSVQRPAEIVNYQSTGATPALLAFGLAAGAAVALGLTLGASVRRRQHRPLRWNRGVGTNMFRMLPLAIDEPARHCKSGGGGREFETVRCRESRHGRTSWEAVFLPVSGSSPVSIRFWATSKSLMLRCAEARRNMSNAWLAVTRSRSMRIPNASPIISRLAKEVWRAASRRS